MRLSILAVLAGLTVATPAHAFDDLLKAVGVLSVDMDQPKAFTYVAPRDGFAQREPAVFNSFQNNIFLPRALVAGDINAATGLDMGRVHAALMVGISPNSTTMLFGAPGFADGAPEALLARDFEQSERDGTTVFAFGDDYMPDLANIDQADPFDTGTGMAQRLAVSDDHVIRTAGWPEMDAALAGLNSPSTMHGIWTNTIIGLRQVSGEGATLDHAQGLTMTAFIPRQSMGLPSTDAKQTKTKMPSFAADQIFPVAVVALTQTVDQAAIHIAAPFNTEPLAQGAGEVIAARLAALPGIPAEPRLDVLRVGEAGPMAVAILSVDVPADQVASLQDHYAGWLTAVEYRNFAPLTFDPLQPQ